MASPKGAAIAKDGDGLRRYLQQIQNLPMLGAQEELELSRRWRKDQDDNAAKQLVASHLRLVAKIAFRYRGYGLPLSDLISEGNVGMMHAVRRFDPEFGFRLASYARWWVRAAIQAYILHSWSLVKIATTAAQRRLFLTFDGSKAACKSSMMETCCRSRSPGSPVFLEFRKRQLLACIAGSLDEIEVLMRLSTPITNLPGKTCWSIPMIWNPFLPNRRRLGCREQCCRWLSVPWINANGTS